MSYDHYKETEELISMLENTAMQHYGKILQSALQGGATGTEIFMALRWNIHKLLQETCLDEAIKAKAKRLIEELEKALK